VPDLTVMTWNIQNLFPVGHPDGPATQQEYDDKVAGLAEVINAVEPDVLALLPFDEPWVRPHLGSHGSALGTMPQRLRGQISGLMRSSLCLLLG
jgi:hypothetical protein